MPADDIEKWKSVEAAFSKQSVHFDKDDQANPVLGLWRQRIYAHVDYWLKPGAKILELNAGTGIDAIHFVKQGHQIHAVDISGGMIERIREKIIKLSYHKEITVQQVSFDQLDKVEGEYDFVFSNFGGLNCIGDLKKVTNRLPSLLNKEAYVTWVIMPRMAPWEWLWILKGSFRKAFRRFSSQGAVARLEGETFTTFYHSLSEVKNSFGAGYQLMQVQGLGVFSPPPSAEKFVGRFPLTASLLNKIDKVLSRSFPFNHWGDHLIVTFKYLGVNEIR